MILGYSNLYPADNCERLLPDPASARRLLDARRPDIPERLDRVFARIPLAPDDAPRFRAASELGLTRLGMRHGSMGGDPHDYHNEEHVLELAERRLGRVMDGAGEAGLPALDAATLVVFAACHDLRQRETFDVPGPIGGNEAASIAETFRILDASGFDRGSDRGLYIALELMIGASTFDPRPLPHADGDGVATAAGGSLARGLGLWLDGERPDWSADPAARRGERLGRLAADLDTGNVGEPFGLFAESAMRLCRERERRAGRALDKPASGASCLGFLSRGQLHYFFELHRFSSREGERVFGPTKLSNAPCVRRVSSALTERYADRPPTHGLEVLEAFAALSAEESAPA